MAFAASSTWFAGHPLKRIRMKPKKRLNLRFVIPLCVGLAVFAIGVRFLYAFQVKNNAAALLRLAQKDAEDEDREKQLRYLNLYLAHVPNDVETLITYGDLLTAAAKHSKARMQALGVFEKVLGLDSNQEHARRQIIQLAMHEQVRRFP